MFVLGLVFLLVQGLDLGLGIFLVFVFVFVLVLGQPCSCSYLVLSCYNLVLSCYNFVSSCFDGCVMTSTCIAFCLGGGCQRGKFPRPSRGVNSTPVCGRRNFVPADGIRFPSVFKAGTVEASPEPEP